MWSISPNNTEQIILKMSPLWCHRRLTHISLVPLRVGLWPHPEPFVGSTSKNHPAPPFEHTVGASQWKAAKTGLNTHPPMWARWGCVGCESRRRPAGRRRSRPHHCSAPGPDAPAAAGGAAVAAGWPRPPPGRRGGASSRSSAGCGTTPSLRAGGRRQSQWTFKWLAVRLDSGSWGHDSIQNRLSIQNSMQVTVWIHFV